jgi:hypothetical protein
MAPANTLTAFESAALERRRALTGTSGPMALLKNIKVFGIACFACLGGLLYGYNQGVFSGVLTMTAFKERKCLTNSTLFDRMILILLNRHGVLHVKLDQIGMVNIHIRTWGMVWNLVQRVSG